VAIIVNYSPFKGIKFKSPACPTTSSVIVNGYFSETQERFVVSDNNKGLFVKEMSQGPDNGPEFSVIC